jgi:hypothetical protein
MQLVDSPPDHRTVPPSRYCSMASQSTAKTCKRKSTWWVSYFSSYGPAAKATCDQHLAAAIRFVRKQAGGGIGEKMPHVYVREDD